jgi:hypothetical protein
MIVSRSAKKYLERRGIFDTHRKPMSTASLNSLRVRDYPLEPPFPIPELRQYTQGDPVPDRGVSKEWPQV